MTTYFSHENASHDHPAHDPLITPSGAPVASLSAEQEARFAQAIELNPPETTYLGKNVVFYDGVCIYCKGIMEASIQSDQRGSFFYSPLQSPFARKTLGRYGIPSLELRSMYVVSDYGTSDEAVRAAAPASNFLLLRLSGELRKLGEINCAKPRAVQDAEYQEVADTRYARHGKMDFVHIPKDESRRLYVF